MHFPSRSLGRVLLIGGCFAVATACSGSVSVGAKTVDKAKVEEQTAVQLAAQTSQPKPTVTCPGDLEAKVGATLECELVAQGDPTKLPVHIVVDSVNEDDVHWNITVGQPGETGSSTTKTP